MPKLKAFLKRDWELAFISPVSLLFETGQTLAYFLSFFFIGKLLGSGGVPDALAPYGGDYFRFVLVGITFSLFMTTALHSVSRTLDFERSHGTLEAILLTPTSFTSLALSKAGWDFGGVIVKSTLYLIAGALLFHVRLNTGQWLPAAIAMTLTTLIFLGLGLISAGLTLLLREANPLESVLGWISRFFAGVYFPIAVLPSSLRKFAAWLPFTDALEAVRHSLIQGIPGGFVKGELLELFGFSAALLPVGILFFEWAFKRARRQGRLGFS